MKHIVSRENPGFKTLKALINDSRELRHRNLAVLDGIHLLSAYLEKIGLPAQVIVSEQGAANQEIRQVCDALVSTEILMLRDNLFRTLSDLTTPTGILALIDIPSPADSLIPQSSCVLLDAIQDPGNVGSILRSAAAAGIRQVYLGTGCAGAWSPRVLRAAQGAHFDLQIQEQADLKRLLVDFNGVSCAATAHDGQSLYRQDLSGSVAWLFGNEGAGISPHLEALARKRIGIPMAAGSESLNVAAAAAICLFEQVRQKTTNNY